MIPGPPPLSSFLSRFRVGTVTLGTDSVETATVGTPLKRSLPAVRDAADGSIVQFMYGDDGSDVTRVSYLKQFSFLAKNAARVAQHLGLEASERTSKVAGTSEVENKVRGRKGGRGQSGPGLQQGDAQPEWSSCANGAST